MLRRTRFAFVAIVLVGACFAGAVGVIPGVTATAAAFQTVNSDDTPGPTNPDSGASAYADDELRELLTTAELLDAWLAAATVSPEASLVALVPSAAYDTERAAFLADVGRFVERRDQIADRAETIDGLEHDIDLVQQLARDLRRSVLTDDRSAALLLTAHEAEQARVTLATVVGTKRWMGISLDPVVLVEHRLVRARDEVAREVDGLAGDREVRDSAAVDKTPDAAMARLTAIQSDLERARALLIDARQISLPALYELAEARTLLVEAMAPLHDRRLMLASIVGGLPVVTLDAYVQGANALDASCPVEWNLLAGVGRVESFHGTIGDSYVQASGRVSNPILGPLLDGGATERELAQAAAAAAQAAAEAALLAQAVPEVEEVAPPEFDASVWGDDTLERAEEQQASATEGHEAVGRAAPPVIVEDAPQPRYDPLLWGDDLPFDDDDFVELDDDQPTDDADADSDDDIPVFRGNGFAVIRDSDNGRLDGNNRWDRAVGPMQFIPETWAYWETDGNGDGTIDPQNLYDAAATAGRFLCHLSTTRGSSPYSFVLGYNSSQTYVRNVMAVADAFGTSALPTVD